MQGLRDSIDESLSTLRSYWDQYTGNMTVTEEKDHSSFREVEIEQEEVDPPEQVVGVIGNGGQKEFKMDKEFMLKATKFFFTYLFAPLYLVIVIFGAQFSRDRPEPVAGLNLTDSKSCPDFFRADPIPDGWRLALSFVPFILVIVGVLGLEIKSHIVAPVTLLVTIVLGLWFFDGHGWLKDYDLVTTSGMVFLTVSERIMWTVFDYAFNVFAAFVFLEVVERWGVVRSMEDQFEVLADDPVKKITLVAFCFAIIIAVVAPGGSNFLIAGSILIRMNIGDAATEQDKLRDGLRIAAICLFGNGLTSAFNLLGVCIIAIAEDIMPTIDAAGLSGPCNPGDLLCATKQIGFQFSIQFFLFGIASPFLMAYLFTQSWSGLIMDNMFILFGCGVIYSIVQLGTAVIMGPELPCLTSALAALFFYMIFREISIRFKIGSFSEETQGNKVETEKQEDIDDDNRSTLSAPPANAFEKHSYILPFALLVVALLLIRVIPNAEHVLQGGDSEVAQRILNPKVMNIHALCGKWVRSFPWLAHPGMIVIECALLTPLMCRFRSTELDREKKKKAHKLEKLAALPFRQRYGKVIKASFLEAGRESAPILVSIASYAAIARVMGDSFEMTGTIALAFVDMLGSAPNAFALIAPIIGLLGSGLSGSTTTSSLLFGNLQLQTAIELGLVSETQGSPYAVAGVQILGSSAGEIISPLNAVFSAVLLKSAVSEAEVIKLVIPLFFGWLVMCMIVSYLALVAFSGAYV